MVLRRGAVIAGGLAALAAALVAPAPARAADPALEALRERDAYISPRVLGPAQAADRERDLAAAAKRMADLGRPVKLALVIGPAGSASLPIYVRRLAARLHFRGTIIVTTRGRAIAAAGPRSTADMTTALRSERVGRIIDPVARLARAADVASPPAPDLDEEARRAALVLIGLAAIGGGWAAAIGLGHQGRRLRREITEARGRARVCVDALRARTIALARRPDLPPDARVHVEQALGVYADAISSLPEMRRLEDVRDFAPRIRAALDDIAATVATVTGEPASGDPFAGLCGIDPAHGPAVTSPGPGGGRALCEGCRAAAERGETLAPRMLFEDGEAVPFDAARYGPELRPDLVA